MFAFLIIKLIVFCIICEGKTLFNVDYIEPGSSIEVSPARTNSFGFVNPSLRVFCYRGRPKYAAHIFHTVNFVLDIGSDDFLEYVGSTPDEVESHRDSKQSFFSFNFGLSKKRNLELHPFNQTCVGVETIESYKVNLHLIRIDLYKVTILCIGIFVLFSATRLSENALFYYLCGVSLGIFASFLLLVYFVSKLLPKRPLMYGMMVGGWALGLYFGQLLWENIQVILIQYQTYAFWYVVISGFLSFVICYRYGPPKDQRSKNLIKWGLQMLAIFIVYQSSHYTEMVMAINVILVLLYYFPKGWTSRGRAFYLRRFPPKRKLLSTEEFYEEGVRETTKALEELRKYCSSPECKAWSTVLRLKEPSRFASFMEGSSHILDTEILDYETSQVDISEDEDSDRPNDEEISEDESENEENRSPGNRNGSSRWNGTQRSLNSLRERGGRASKSRFRDDDS
ncbi:nuclear envelope integral membrane protein 1 [Sergentomyia squamirostris]